MFDVTFYTFSKRFNSTKRPTGGTKYRCVVLNGTGVMNPKIELDIGLTSNPSQFNYCYIPDFHRYYYVREWSFMEGLWIASLDVDVLSTYKDKIGNTSLYVLRASNDYDGRIVDGKYPVKSGCDFSRQTITSPYTSINSGCFVIGVVSKGGNFGSLTYHAMTAGEMGSLCSNLIDPTAMIADVSDFSLDDASAGLQLNLIDPMQYIKSCVWLPFAKSSVNGTDIPASGPTGGFDIFNWHLTGFTHRILSNSAPYVNISKSFAIPKHPDTTSRGNYVNCAPYTIATLSFPPFGVIEIDTSVLCNASALSVNLIIDPLTGKGTIVLKANNIILNRIEAQIGVPIQLSQVTRDYVGAVNNALGAVGNAAGAIGSFASGGIAGGISAVTGAAQGIINAAVSLVPRANTIGTGGGFSHLQGDFELDFQFFRPVADDLTHNGRPLCQRRYPKNLGGYMIIQDGDVSTTGTAAENERVQAHLEGGFYYE